MSTHEANVVATVRFTTPYQDDEGDWHGSGLLADIVNESARQLLTELRSSLSYDRDRVQRALQAKIDEHVTGLLDEALHEALQPTDHFGKPKGEPKTMEEIIVAQVDDFLRRATRSDNYDRSPALVDKHLQDAVSKVVKKELSEALNEAVANVRAAVEAEGARMLGATLFKLAKEVPVGG